MAAPPGSPKGRHAGRVVIRVRKEDYSRKTAHVAAREVASYSVVRKALLGAVGTDHDLWWPQPLESARPGDDPWAVVLKDELAWRKKVPRKAIDSAEAWAACLAATSTTEWCPPSRRSGAKWSTRRAPITWT